MSFVELFFYQKVSKIINKKRTYNTPLTMMSWYAIAQRLCQSICNLFPCLHMNSSDDPLLDAFLSHVTLDYEQLLLLTYYYWKYITFSMYHSQISEQIHHASRGEESTLYWTSALLLATICCFLLFHVIKLFHRNKLKPVTDFLVFNEDFNLNHCTPWVRKMTVLWRKMPWPGVSYEQPVDDSHMG